MLQHHTYIAQFSTSPHVGSNQESSSSSSYYNKRTSTVDREMQAIAKSSAIVSADQLYNAEREKYIKAIPTGVLLKSDGSVKVFFTLTGAEYEVGSR